MTITAKSGKERVETLNRNLSELPPEQALRKLPRLFRQKVVFSTSLGLEDQAITHAILSNRLPIEIFTLDTGRLFPEIYALMDEVTEKYGVRIKVFCPRHDLLEEFVKKQGVNGFYHSPENRRRCCFIRKVEPLSRALKGAGLWVTGIRKAQSDFRAGMNHFEYDTQHDLIKFNPLLNWSLDDVRNYITENDVPVSPLHDRGYLSVGCAPCTRPVPPGESVRAGRWWWESEDKKECGLHFHPSLAAVGARHGEGRRP